MRITGWSLSSEIRTERYFTFLNYISWSFLLKGILGHENLLFCLPHRDNTDEKTGWGWGGIQSDGWGWVRVGSKELRCHLVKSLQENSILDFWAQLIVKFAGFKHTQWQTVLLETVTESLVGLKLAVSLVSWAAFRSFWKAQCPCPDKGNRKCSDLESFTVRIGSWEQEDMLEEKLAKGTQCHVPYCRVKKKKGRAYGFDSFWWAEENFWQQETDFTKVKAESVFRIVFILWVSPISWLTPTSETPYALLLGPSIPGLWLQSWCAESA